MRRKRAEGPPVTLFSFQDIITSISGIMILVVLMLILGIIEEKTIKTVIKSQNQQVKDDIKALQKTFIDLKADIDNNEKWLNENEKNIQDAISNELDNLPKFIQKEKDKIETTDDNIKTAENTTRKLKDENDATAKDIQEINVLKRQLSEKLTSLEKEKGDILKILALEEEKLKKELEKKLNSIVFSVENEDGKASVLVECSANAIIVKKGNTPCITFIETEANNSARIINEFKQWLTNNCTPRNNLIFFLVKASSAGYFQELESYIMEKEYHYGMEPLEEEKSIGI
jgi:DNA repair exonuclease SbcCD ATPase subunit